ncbi:exodeoxyribonuclease VII small subunit [Demequina muriae]|uniref:Exodeoxyribonuclease 7 small subunit n=1 Tax=Demequina muriae TaxID=3051664 RepID=A0ABT8GF23_9MICO|nr:exodeoxyribonuclease VII small subunit [Demequina sp. EGI L300058]MDN4480025.1 exodeoxyribonuclease VII small subunit [Demequina sp. EGI L300058]
MSHADDVSSLTYEQARDELIAIVAKLEAGAATLDESVGLWERGEALAARCQELLEGARDRITDARGETEQDDDADAGIVGFVPADDAGADDTADDAAARPEEDHS